MHVLNSLILEHTLSANRDKKDSLHLQKSRIGDYFLAE